MTPRQGGAASCAKHSRSGAALHWRTCSYEPVAIGWVEELEERRLLAVEQRIDADLACGESSNLVPELQQLVREHPLRERLIGQLMLALYRAGRHSDALAVFAAARQRLAGELGLDPGPRLRELERQILRHDSGLDVRPRSAPRRRAGRRRRAWALGGVALAALVALPAVLVVRARRRRAPLQAPDYAESPALARHGLGDRPPQPRHSTPCQQAIAAGSDAYLAGVGELARRPANRCGDRHGRGPHPARRPAGQRRGGPSRGLGRQHVDRHALAHRRPRPERSRRPCTWAARMRLRWRSGEQACGWRTRLIAPCCRSTRTRARFCRTVTLDGRPAALAVASRSVWVADHESGRVTEIDGPSGKTLAAVDVGGGPVALAVTRDAVWVAEQPRRDRLEDRSGDGQGRGDRRGRKRALRASRSPANRCG